MTVDLEQTVFNHPDLKESCELLFLHGDDVVFRTVDKHTVGEYGEYDKQHWYSQSLSGGKPRFIMQSHEYDGTRYNPNDNNDKLYMRDGVPWPVNTRNGVICSTVAAMLQSNVSADEIRKGLASLGVDMQSLYPGSYKLERNYLGGWSIKLDGGSSSVEDFLVRLNEVTTA